MNYININGAQLAYEQQGSGNRDILFVHGYLSRATGEAYQPLKDCLSASARLHCLDMRGHGGSSGVTRQVTLDQCVEDLIAFAKQLKLERLYYAGHSMGGFLGLSAAIRSPDLFSGLALFTPALAQGLPPNHDQINLVLSGRKTPEILDTFNRMMFVRDVPRTLLDRIREDSLLFSEAHHERWLKEEWPGTDIAGGLITLRTPTLCVNGLKDILVDPEQQHRDVMNIPDAKEVVFTNEGHMMPFEAPGRCAKEALRFFDDLECAEREGHRDV